MCGATFTGGCCLSAATSLLTSLRAMAYVAPPQTKTMPTAAARKRHRSHQRRRGGSGGIDPGGAPPGGGGVAGDVVTVLNASDMRGSA